jgi:hypothetical protein
MMGIDLQSALQGFLGAVFGSLLIPFVTHYLEKRKHRVKLRLELIAQVHIIHQLFKADLIQKNVDGLNARLHDIYNTIAKNTQNPTDKTSAETIRDRYAKFLDEIKPRTTELFNQIIQIEGELVKSVVDIQGSYGYDMYLKVNQIINRVLENASNPEYFYLHNYSEMNLSDLNDVDKIINKEVLERSKMINADCVIIKEQVNLLLAKNEAMPFRKRITSSWLWYHLTFKWASRD